MYLVAVISNPSWVMDAVVGERQAISNVNKLGAPSKDQPAVVLCTSEDEARDVAQRMSNKFVGQEIGIYRGETLFIRPAGEMVVRKVTEQGVFPE